SAGLLKIETRLERRSTISLPLQTSDCLRKRKPNYDLIEQRHRGCSVTIIVYRQWSFSGAGRPSWKFNVDNGPDLIVRNGTYLRLDVAPGEHVLDHKHMFPLGSDSQTVRVKA